MGGGGGAEIDHMVNVIQLWGSKYFNAIGLILYVSFVYWLVWFFLYFLLLGTTKCDA